MHTKLQSAPPHQPLDISDLGGDAGAGRAERDQTEICDAFRGSREGWGVGLGGGCGVGLGLGGGGGGGHFAEDVFGRRGGGEKE